MSQRKIEIVLVGGGACNVQVMRTMHWENIPGINVTLVSDTKYSVYSGMLPLVIEDKCPDEGIMISLSKLAAFGNGKFVHAQALNIDTATRELKVRPLSPKAPEGTVERIPYDILSINVGSVTYSASEILGINEHAIKTRPAKDVMPRLIEFQHRWFPKHAGTDRPLRMCVVGAGMAGVELGASIKKRLERKLDEEHADNNVECTVISHLPLQKCLRCDSFARKVQRALDRRRIQTLFGPKVVKIDNDKLHLDNSSTIPYDLVIYAAGTAAPQFVTELGLSGALELSKSGFISVRDTLQATQPDIFAAGDCTTMKGHEDIPKAGVYAIKEGPIVIHNILTIARAFVKAAQKCPPDDKAAWEEARTKTLSEIGSRLRVFVPPRDCMQIVNLGDGTGIASWKGRSFQGSLIWKLKVMLDRKWVKHFAMCGVTKEDLTDEVAISEA